MKTIGVSVSGMQKIITQTSLATKASSPATREKAPGISTPVVLPADIAEISDEARRGQDDFQRMLDELRERYRTLREGLIQARETSSGMAEAMKEKIICLRIAMRIMSGGKVPLKDRRYLMEKDPELYKQAICLRVEKKNPKKYDRLSEDEEKVENADSDNSADGSADSLLEADEIESIVSEGDPQ